MFSKSKFMRLLGSPQRFHFVAFALLGLFSSGIAHSATFTLVDTSPEAIGDNAAVIRSAAYDVATQSAERFVVEMSIRRYTRITGMAVYTSAGSLSSAVGDTVNINIFRSSDGIPQFPDVIGIGDDIDAIDGVGGNGKYIRQFFDFSWANMVLKPGDYYIGSIGGFGSDLNQLLVDGTGFRSGQVNSLSGGFHVFTAFPDRDGLFDTPSVQVFGSVSAVPLPGTAGMLIGAIGALLSASFVYRLRRRLI